MTEIIPNGRLGTSPARGETLGPRPTAPSRRRVYVLFTDIEGTLRAVGVARRFAPAFGGHVTVVHFRPLDFAAPLDAPSGISPTETDEFRERVAAEGCEVDVEVCVCRNARRALTSVLDPHALVVVGGHHRWWPTGAERWRRRLEAAGHMVVFADEAVCG